MKRERKLSPSPSPYISTVFNLEFGFRKTNSNKY